MISIEASFITEYRQSIKNSFIKIKKKKLSVTYFKKKTVSQTYQGHFPIKIKSKRNK